MTETPSTPSSSPSSPEAETGPVTTPPTTAHPPSYQQTTPTYQHTPPVYAGPEQPRHSRLNVVAAWVGIVAGVVFIVTLIFGTGYVLGAHSGGGWHHGRGPDSMMMQRGAPPQPPLLFPMGPRAQQERPFPPGLLPGAPGLAPAQPGGPASTAPARP